VASFDATATAIATAAASSSNQQRRAATASTDATSHPNCPCGYVASPNDDSKTKFGNFGIALRIQFAFLDGIYGKRWQCDSTSSASNCHRAAICSMWQRQRRGIVSQPWQLLANLPPSLKCHFFNGTLRQLASILAAPKKCIEKMLEFPTTISILFADLNICK